MEKREEIKFIVGVPILFLIVTKFFSLLSKISSVMYLDGSIKTRIGYFLQRNLLWIVVILIIICIFVSYLKRVNEKVYPNLLDIKIIRLTSGLLILLDGVMSLSTLLMGTISSIKSELKTMELLGDVSNIMLKKIISANVTSVVLILLQIFVGIFFIKFYKSKEVDCDNL